MTYQGPSSELQWNSFPQQELLVIQVSFSNLFLLQREIGTLNAFWVFTVCAAAYSFF